jgi:hypothetical protein
LIWKPDVFWQFSRTPEHIDWYAATRIPVAADAQIDRLKNSCQAAADSDRGFLVETAVIAEGREEEFKRLRFDEPVFGDNSRS